MNNKLDVFEILSEKDNKEKLDIFEVMNSRQNQEHNSAPDFDLLNAKETSDNHSSELQSGQRQEKSETGRRMPAVVLKTGVLVLVIVVLMLLFCGFIKVPDGSMEPSLSPGDITLTIKSVKNCRPGDIIVFKDSSGQKHFARIVADSGDVVSITAKKGLLVNNKKSQYDEYAVGMTEAGSYTVYPMIVSENEFFVLGDNRENSLDSRSQSIGTLDKSDLKGKVVYCFKSIK